MHQVGAATERRSQPSTDQPPPPPLNQDEVINLPPPPTQDEVINLQNKLKFQLLSEYLHQEDQLFKEIEEFNKKIDEQLQGLNRSTSKEASLVTFKQAVFGAKYRKATWVCCLLNVFNQQSGIGMVSMFATRMLILIHE